MGYGISLSTASALIEYNIFNWNRHSIAGTGQAGCSYTARHNVVVEESISHCFDMHGGIDRKDGTKIAGTLIRIYNNTFKSTKPAVFIRGIPEDKCEIYNNWFVKHDNVEKAVRVFERATVENNIYGKKPKAVE